MELRISTYTDKSFSSVGVARESGGATDLIFSAVGYSSARPNSSVSDDEDTDVKFDMFGEINLFFQKHLSEEQKDQLFTHYERLESLSTQTDLKECSFKDLTRAIIKEVNGIYSVVKFADLREFVSTHTAIRLPAGLSDDYVTEDKITPTYKSLTYRLQEYIDLLAVALGLRLMIPVWGFYLAVAHKESGVNMKEFTAYQLIQGSKFYKSHAFDRLDVYVRTGIRDNVYDVTAALNFMSSEEIPTYLLALAVIRKLSIVQLSAERERDHLMKILFNYIDGRFKRMATEFKQQVAEKKSGGGPIEDNSSVWSMFKMKESISKGELVVFELAVNDYHVCAAFIDAGFNAERLIRCVEHVHTIDNFDPSRAQKGLAAWILSTVIPGVVIDLFNVKELKHTMAVAQTILWEWGFLDLAIMMTARRDKTQTVHELSKAKVNQFNRDLLDVINPYMLPDPKRDDQYFIANSAVRGIEEIVREFMRAEWFVDCPHDLAFQYNRSDLTEYLDIEPSVRNRLAEILIRLNDHIR